MKKHLFLTVLLVFCVLLAGCTAAEDNSPRITVSGDGISGELVFSMNELAKEGAYDAVVYSVVNNWPSDKFCIAEGVTLESLLKKAGVWDSFQTVTVAAADGYSTTFTREQIMIERFYYPGLLEDDESGKEARPFLLTTKYAGDTDDMADLEEEEAPRLVFGQSYIEEHNTVAFVENVAFVTVSNTPAEKWANPGAFPESGEIRKGETVKLTHDFFGMLKIFYTLDGTDPTVNSAMYNPSTYQPKVNAPIPIEQDVVIKAFAWGYGYADSDIVTFEFKVK